MYLAFFYNKIPLNFQIWTDTTTVLVCLYKNTFKIKIFLSGGVVLSTEATGERGRQWQKMIQKPGKNSQYWHKLDVDEWKIVFICFLLIWYFFSIFYVSF